MSKVVAFIDGGDETVEHFNTDLVAMLEEVLARAKSGSITAVACAIVRSDGQVQPGGYQVTNGNVLGLPFPCCNRTISGA